MKWTDYLNPDVSERLRNCVSRTSDIPALVDAKWRSYKEMGKDKEGFTREDALVSVLELLDSNGFDADLTIEEYNDIVNSI